jgi:5-methylcytosine-specific restriction protein A
MPRKKRTTAQRLAIFKAHHGVCHLCGMPIQVGEKWELEHVIALEISGDDSDANLRPAHLVCHADKTKADVKAIAKVKRVEAKHHSAKAPPKQKIQSKPFAKAEKIKPAGKPSLKPRMLFRAVLEDK